MKLIKKKIAPKWYTQQMAGLKPWELRVNDCDYQKGDFLILQEWENGGYTERELPVVITNVADGLPYIPDDVVILTTREATPNEKDLIRKMIKEEKENDCR